MSELVQMLRSAIRKSDLGIIVKAEHPDNDHDITWLVDDAADEIEQLQIRAEDAEMLADRRKWGAKEMDRLRARVEELEEASVVDFDERDRLLARVEELEEAGSDLIRVSLAILGEADGYIITHEQIDAAWLHTMVRHGSMDDGQPDRETSEAVTAALLELNIHQCEECGGSGGSGGYSTYDFVSEEAVGGFEPCPGCAPWGSRGWVIREVGNG